MGSGDMRWNRIYRRVKSARVIAGNAGFGSRPASAAWVAGPGARASGASQGAFGIGGFHA
jgi:hypothetical protein